MTQLPSHTETSPLLIADNIRLVFGDKTVLDNAALSIQPGEIVTLIGPNGAGKTSLVKIVLGLLKPTSGTIRQASKLRIGYMPQKLSLDASLPLTLKRFLQLSGAADADIEHALSLTRIQHLAHQPLTSLSGGETQRALLARAILRQPDLLVLDEPVQGVDLAGQSELYELISHLRDSLGCAVLMISHDLHLVMAKTDTVICLNRHVCCHGQPEAVSTDPAYLELFGDAHHSVALYTHHHDHKHNAHGDIVTEAKPENQESENQ